MWYVLAGFVLKLKEKATIFSNCGVTPNPLVIRGRFKYFGLALGRPDAGKYRKTIERLDVERRYWK